MTQQRRETINIDSTFEDYKYMYYKRLRDGKVKVMLSENVFRCPYCPVSREYGYEEELCRHASRIARESKTDGLKEKAKHIGLLEFLMLEEMRKRREELERKINMTDYLMDSVMKQKDMMIDNFNREVKMMQEKENEKLKKFIIEYEQTKLQLEDGEKKLRARAAINGNENRKLDKEKKTNELAILEQKKANDRMLKLADYHKREKEKLYQKIMELQKKLDDKQGLELEIIQLKGAMEVMKHNTDKDVEAKKKFESMKENLKEKEEELEKLEELNQALIVKERKNHDELQDAQKELISENNKEESVVWPLMVVVANIPFEHKDDSYLDDGFLGDIAKNLKDEWIKEGYKPVKVYPLWSCLGHSGFAVVEFGEEWDGFNNAKMFVKDFEVEKHGRKDWYDSNSFKDDKLYSWIANDEDYYSSDLVGDYLREHADLKTVSDFLKEAQVKISELYLGLKTNFEETKKRNEEFHKAMMIEDFDFMIAGFDMTIENYKTEHAMMQEKVNEQLKKISTETKLQLEEHDKEMRAHEAVNETAQKKVHNEKKMNKLAVLEQKKVDDRMSKLADEQKKKLDVRQRLELGINQMKGTLEVMKHITDEDVDAKELRAHEALNESDQMKVGFEKKMKELTVLEQKEADDRMLKVDDDQKVLKE